MNTVTPKRISLLALSVVVAVSGCAVSTPVKPGDPAYAPVMSLPQAQQQPQDGSLFLAGNGMQLFADRKATRVGDVITIVLDERTVSQKTNNVSISKESDASFNAGPILGTNPSYKNLSLDTDIQQDRDFEGEADADQSNSLQGNITVTVSDILPNGNLVVRGEKWMMLTRGDEYIRISGILRPEDVTPENTVPSNRLANARISYSGTGELADSSEMGWITKFFNSPVWPF
jgi:flagellar L-ring protein precursor FlgH